MPHNNHSYFPMDYSQIWERLIEAIFVFGVSSWKTVRQDATYNKDYFSGKYGAIPVIKETGNMNGGDLHGQTETVY